MANPFRSAQIGALNRRMVLDTLRETGRSTTPPPPANANGQGPWPVDPVTNLPTNPRATNRHGDQLYVFPRPEGFGTDVVPSFVTGAQPMSGGNPFMPQNFNYGEKGKYDTLAQDLMLGQMGNASFNNEAFGYTPAGMPSAPMYGGAAFPQLRQPSRGMPGLPGMPGMVGTPFPLG